MGSSRLLPLLPLLLLAPGCRTPTSVELRLSTDVRCEDHPSTAVIVSRSSTATQEPATITTACQPDGTIGSVVILPASSKDETLQIKVVTSFQGPVETACVAPNYGPTCIISRRQLAFVPHEELSLPVQQTVDCAGLVCGESQTCRKGSCVSAKVDLDHCKDSPDDCGRELLSPPDAGAGGAQGGGGQAGQAGAGGGIAGGGIAGGGIGGASPAGGAGGVSAAGSSGTGGQSTAGAAGNQTGGASGSGGNQTGGASGNGGNQTGAGQGGVSNGGAGAGQGGAGNSNGGSSQLGGAAGQAGSAGDAGKGGATGGDAGAAQGGSGNAAGSTGAAGLNGEGGAAGAGQAGDGGNAGTGQAGDGGNAGAGQAGDGGNAGAGQAGDGGNAGAGGAMMPPTIAVIPLSMGHDHTCALQITGTVVCWGRGDQGELGLGNTMNVGDIGTPFDNVPIPPPVGATIAQVSAGAEHSCLLFSTGQVRCWGRGAEGQLGYGNPQNIGDVTPASSALDVPLDELAVQIEAGSYHTCARLQSGAVRCWGANGFGQLGTGNKVYLGDNEPITQVVPIQLGARATQVAAGYQHTCALLEGGSVRCWGRNQYGQLGLGLKTEPSISQQPDALPVVQIPEPVTFLAAGGFHTCVIVESGAVRCWGAGGFGQLGISSNQNIGDDETPAMAPTLPLPMAARQLDLGINHSCALLVDGSLYCWGWGNDYRLGYGTLANIGDSPATSIMMPVSVGGPVARVVAGDVDTCALLQTGEVRCWGASDVGQLGLGTTMGTMMGQVASDMLLVPLDKNVKLPSP